MYISNAPQHRALPQQPYKHFTYHDVCPRHHPATVSAIRLRSLRSHLLTSCLSSGLVVLSVLSFMPQIRHIKSRGELTGISLSYILFNLIVTTHLFALSLEWFLIDNENQPPNISNRLDTTQFMVFWMGHIGL
jgi:hypothetical protein